LVLLINFLKDKAEKEAKKKEVKEERRLYVESYCWSTKEGRQIRNALFNIKKVYDRGMAALERWT
jgi:hypothetical protein